MLNNTDVNLFFYFCHLQISNSFTNCIVPQYTANTVPSRPLCNFITGHRYFSTTAELTMLYFFGGTAFYGVWFLIIFM